MTIVPVNNEIIFRYRGRGQTVVDEGGYRSLYFEPPWFIQSRMNLQYPLWLILPYLRHMLACLLFNYHPKNVLIIGLGGGSLAKFFLHYFPECRVDGVDSNPVIASIAHQFFYLPKDNRLTLYCSDGADFITKRSGLPPRYDLILVDAFDHKGMANLVYVPSFFMKTCPLLSDTGVLVLNVFPSEIDVYNNILRSINYYFANSAFRLPVLNIDNEIVLCCTKTNNLNVNNLSEFKKKSLSWGDQPHLSFSDFLGFINRLIPFE